jgi:hypothetical protein
MTERQHTSAERWRSSVASFLSDGSAEGGGGTSWPSRSSDLNAIDFFLWGLWKTKLRFANAYNLEQLKVSNTNIDCKNWSDFIAECLARSRISFWSVQGNKWRAHWTCIGYENKSILSFCLQWCASNRFVAITFFPINLCNGLRHLYSLWVIILHCRRRLH